MRPMRITVATIFLMQATVVILFVMVIASFNQSLTTNQTAKTVVQPVPGPKGQDAVVDYQKIEALIDQKITQLPKSKDGLSGVDGASGVSGTNGTNGIDGKTPVKGVDYEDGKQGERGDPGLTYQTVEQRSNPFTFETEWRCVGDTGWITLKSRPILQDSCL